MRITTDQWQQMTIEKLSDLSLLLRSNWDGVSVAWNVAEDTENRELMVARLKMAQGNAESILYVELKRPFFRASGINVQVLVHAPGYYTSLKKLAEGKMDKQEDLEGVMESIMAEGKRMLSMAQLSQSL